MSPGPPPPPPLSMPLSGAAYAYVDCLETWKIRQPMLLKWTRSHDNITLLLIHFWAQFKVLLITFKAIYGLGVWVPKGSSLPIWICLLLEFNCRGFWCMASFAEAYLVVMHGSFLCCGICPMKFSARGCLHCSHHICFPQAHEIFCQALFEHLIPLFSYSTPAIPLWQLPDWTSSVASLLQYGPCCLMGCFFLSLSWNFSSSYHHLVMHLYAK